MPRSLDDGFSEMLTRGTGVERGFAQFRETDELRWTRRDDRGTAETALRAAAKARRADQRVFVWAHFFGTHAPNTMHPARASYGDSLVDGYDHEINYFDSSSRKLLQRVSAGLSRRC